MNTIHTTSENSFRRSTESILSLQGHETDFVRDTSDTDEGRDVEYEPVSESESEQDWESDDSSHSEIITTKVIAVSVGDEGDLEFADSEQTDSEGSDSELDFNDYWQCAGCRANNNNPVYRFCETCFKVRKSLFPPRPKRKHRALTESKVVRTLSQDSGVESQELSQQDVPGCSVETCPELETNITTLKRRRDQSNSDSDTFIPLKITKKNLGNSFKTIESDSCIICCNAPKSGVFVHGKVAHICCCYKCALKVWSKNKRCPICNGRVSNVLKAVVL